MSYFFWKKALNATFICIRRKDKAIWYYFNTTVALMIGPLFEFDIYQFKFFYHITLKTCVSSVCYLGWGLLTTVAALSCIGLLRLQHLFYELNHGQKAPEEDQPDHPRWGKLCRCIFAHSAVICNLSRWCYLIFIYVFFSFDLPPTTTSTMIQISAKQTLPVKRPIQIGPKVSIQPKPLITAMPLTHSQAPIQAKTIIIQPLQSTVLPVVKPAPINIQPAPPTGQISHRNTCRT